MQAILTGDSPQRPPTQIALTADGIIEAMKDLRVPHNELSSQHQGSDPEITELRELVKSPPLELQTFSSDFNSRLLAVFPSS